MRTIYERDDVSKFRQFVRNSRFQTPEWKSNIKNFCERLVQDKYPAVAVISTKENRSKNANTIDSIGAGKTDFVYHALEFLRGKGMVVLAFPDIKEALSGGKNFYRELFIPEISRLTDSPFHRFISKAFIYVTEYIWSFIRIIFIFIRTSVFLFVSLLLFLSAGGFGAIKFIIEKNPSLVPFVPLIPAIVTLVLVIWVIYVMDKIRNDEKRWAEFKSLAPRYRIERRLIGISTRTSFDDLYKKMSKWKKDIVIIIDDAEFLDNESFNSLKKLEIMNRNNQGGKFILARKERRKKYRLGLILLFDDLVDPSLEMGNTMDEFVKITQLGLLQDNWLNYSLLAPKEYEVRLLLWGRYDSPKCDEYVDLICRRVPDTLDNTGFLLQYFYELAKIIEESDRDFDLLERDELLEWFNEFLAGYTSRAELYLNLITSHDFAYSGKEFLKILLSFGVEKAEVPVVKYVLETLGIDNCDEIAQYLISLGIVEYVRNQKHYFAFSSSSTRNVLNLTWNDWRQSSTDYISIVFHALHDVAASSIKERQNIGELAKFCGPSTLVVDTLWREGNAAWLFGGNADTDVALSYYGLGRGALGKWYRLFDEAKNERTVDDTLFYWNPEAKNSQYKYIKRSVVRTSKSPRKSFVGNLIKINLQINFLNGNISNMKWIMYEFWPEVLLTALSSSNVSSQTKNMMRSIDEEMRMLFASQLFFGSRDAEDFSLSKSITRNILDETENASIRTQSQFLQSKFRYFAEYGIGNLLPPIALIKSPEISAFSNDQSSIKRYSFFDALEIYAINVNHKYEYFRYLTSEKRSSLLDIENVIEEVLSLLKNWYEYLDLSDAFDIKFVDRKRGEELETLLLISQGNLYYNVARLFTRLPQKIETKKSSRTATKIESRIIRYYEFSKELHSIERQFRETANNSELEDLYSTVEDIYNEYFSSSRKSNYAFEQKIKEGVSLLTDGLAMSFADDSLRYYEYARNIATLRKIKPYQNSIEYLLLRIILFAHSIQSDVLETDYSWHKEIINENESKSKPFLGFSLDAIVTHIFLAHQRGITELAYSAQEFGKAIENIRIVENHVPSICVGELINRQLREIGNTSEVYDPDEILELARRALSTFIDIQASDIKDYIDVGKAHIRWWIAEAYARLASKNSEQIDEYWKLARDQLNWIRRHSQDSSEIKDYYLPKVKQTEGRFYSIRGNLSQATSHLKGALEEFQKEDNWFECIQTLLSLIPIERKLLQEKDSSGREITNDEKIRFSQLFGKLDTLFERGRKEIEQGSHAHVHLYLLKTADFLASNLSPEHNEMSLKLIDYWNFSIDGYKKFSLHGMAAIVASKMKLSGVELPNDFESVCHELFFRWDPRYEKTNRFIVEQAFKSLTGAVSTSRKTDEIKNSKTQAILDTQRLLARDHTDVDECLSILSHEVDKIDDNNPQDVDLILLRWLWRCYAQKGDLNQGDVIRSREEHISGILSSKNCLDLALSFEDHPQIHERFLTLAASVVGGTHNPYAEKAARMLDKLYGKIPPIREDVIRTEGEHLTFDRLMNLSLQQYDQETSYSLAFVLETEMRRLIAHVLGEHDRDWWKNLIPPDVKTYAEKGYRKQVTTRGKASGHEYLEYINLGDLFKIILQRTNWRECFEVVFKSKEYVNSKANTILNKRHDIMHSRKLHDDDLYEFVTVTRNFIRVMEPFLPK